MSGKPFCGKCNKPKSQCKCGRPTVMTEAVIGKLEEALRIDCTIGMACSYAGINESTYYDHYKNDEVFSKRMDDAEKYLHLLAHQQRAKKIKDGERDAIKEFKKKRDVRYKDKSEVDQNRRVMTLDNMFDEDADNIKKQILQAKQSIQDNGQTTKIN